MHPVNEGEVINILKDMKTSSAWWGCIIPNIIEKTGEYFCTFWFIFAMCLSWDVYSQMNWNSYSHAFSRPESKYHVYYRTVSTLPMFSKGLERLNYDRILAFVKENHMIYNVQFGFREGHYTSNALILITDRISKSLYNGEWPWVFPLYFDTAFDMINYETFCWEVLSCMVSQALFMIGWTVIYRIGPYIFYRWC